MAENKVDNTHPKYNELQPLRDVFDDVCNGTAAMRKGDVKYLPKFPKETPDSYAFRKDTATFLNVTAKTRETLCGLVFQKDITLGEDVPDATVKLWENIDNCGNHGNVFSRDLFEDSFDGSAVILVDAPTAQASDKGEQNAMGLRPYWVAYDACDVINWDYRINPVSRKKELSLIVLRESHTVAEAMFTRKSEVHYLVCYLNGNTPSWQRWKETKDAGGKTEHVLDSEGIFGKQTALPIAIVGELDDAPPLMDLAYKNVEHYQTYSDYKSIIHKTCVPLFYSINLDGEPVAIGGDVWFKCNEGGSIGFAEVSGTSIDKTEQCLENIKQEMGTLGLAMLAAKPVKGDTTATETMLDSIQETSSLQVRATQLKDAVELALGFTAQYLGLGADKGGTITLGATWTQMIVTAEELNAWSGLVDAGQMSLETFVELRHAAGHLPEDVTVEIEMDRIEKEMKANAGVKPVVDANGQPNETATTKTQPPVA